MAQGFQSSDETKIAIAVKRLSPAAKRNDIHAFADGVRHCQERYGKAIADKAMQQIFEQYHDLAMKCMSFLPNDMQNLARDTAFEILAEQIENAGLRLEEHFRVSDKGIAFTKDAIAAIRATGCPVDFGEGNDSLEGIGLDRTNGFMHPLAETFEHRGEDCINSWGVASMCINSAAGWVEANSDQGFSTLQQFVSQIAPTIDVQKLLYQSRYDDRALMRLCQLAADGLTAKARQAHEQR